MFEVNNLGVKYSGSTSWALEDISFLAKQGEITLITGPSGAGKSTLAQTMMTLIPKFTSGALTGEILIDNMNIQSFHRSELIKFCGYVPQYPADFVTTLAVEEEVASILENLGLVPEEINSRLDEIFPLLEINHLRGKLQTELSSGELQRVAIATAIAPNIPILILDEPMARIDLKSEVLLVELLVKLAQEGRTVIVFEHRLEYLLGVSHQVILMENGRIKAQGSPKDIINDLLLVDPPEISQLQVKDSPIIPVSLHEAQKLLEKHLL